VSGAAAPEAEAAPAAGFVADGVFHARGVLGREERERWLVGAYAARAAWTPSFEGAQFTLGRAYYTHLEEGRAAEYFAAARASDEAVARAMPGMQARMRAIVASLCASPVAPRAGWCGAGVHIFPAGGWLADRGGDVHFDTEGLLPDELAARAPALSAILMLQPPARGGGLRVWDALYDGDDVVPPRTRARRASVTVDYAPGDLVVIDSYRLHQIQPFAGTHDRISITLHAVKSKAGWTSWF